MTSGRSSPAHAWLRAVMAGRQHAHAGQQLVGVLPHVGLGNAKLFGELLADVLRFAQQIVQMAVAIQALQDSQPSRFHARRNSVR